MQTINQNICKLTVEVCVGNCCYIKGAPALINRLHEINHSIKQFELSILPVFCLGNCMSPPSIRINEELYSDVNEDDLIKILNNIINSE